MKRKGILYSLLFAIGCCAPGMAAAGKADDTLNVALDLDIESMDVYMTSSRSGIIAGRMVYDMLVDRDPVSGEFKPLLASAYHFVDDSTLEFDLRQGVSFHNGEPFDADDVVYTLQTMMRADSGIKTRSNVAWIAGVEKIGPYKVRIVMKAPTPAALEYLAGALPIYPNEYYAKVGSRGMSTQPVGTGPYRMAEAKPGERFVMEKNAAYFAGSPKGAPAIGKLVVRILPEQNTQLLELMSGQLDWIWKVAPDQAKQVARRPTLQVVNEQTMRIGYMQFAAGEGSPFADQRVRQAVAYTVNRGAIVQSLVQGASKVIDAPCFPTQIGCSQDVTRYTPDLDKARKLMAEAGYADGFSVDFPVIQAERVNAEAIVGNLRDIGIRANLQPLQYAAVRDKVRSGEAKMALLTWGSYSINDVSSSTSVFFRGGPDDVARDPAVQAALAKGDTSIDRATRDEAYREAMKRITDQAYWLPLWTHNMNYAFTKDLVFTPSVDEIPRFYAARWK